MRISLIVNTCAMDPLAGKPLYGRRTYRERADLLRRTLVDTTQDDWDEIIVVGSFEPPPEEREPEAIYPGKAWRRSYTYVPMDPICRDRRDALWQRELGARTATGDLLAFSHDDHAFAMGTPSVLRAMQQDDWDLLVPQRVNLMGDELNNGRAEGYMGGHSLVMKRWLWARVPWTAVDTEWWDQSLSRIWREEGGRIAWTDDIAHIDLDS